MEQAPVFPVAAIESVIRRGFTVCADAEQAAEGVERIEATIEPEGELVEVGLQVLGLDPPVMRSWRGIEALNEYNTRES